MTGANVNANAAEAGAGRYLRYDELRPIAIGFDHRLSDLECILREAHASGRQALLPSLNLTAFYNFGIERDWRWDAYVDLEASRLLDSAGEEHPLPLVYSLPKTELPTLTLEPGEGMPERAADFPLVVRRIRSNLFGKDVPFADPAVGFAIQPSRRVVDLAASVMADLLSRGSGRFVAIHIRRGNRLGVHYPPRLTAPDGVARHLREQGIAEGAVVYALSDEQDADYWRRMARLPWQVVRHADYPALSDLLRQDDGRVPDNYLLYAVEKRIMAAAAVRIETLARGSADADSALVPETIWRPRVVAKERAEKLKRILRPAVAVARRLGLRSR